MFLLPILAFPATTLLNTAQAAALPAARPIVIDRDGNHNAETFNIRLQAINRLYLAAQYGQAEQLVTILDKDYPDMVSIKSLQARILFALGKLREAERVADELADTQSLQSKELAQYIRQTIQQKKAEEKNYNIFSMLKIGNAINTRAVPVHRLIDYNWEYIGLDGFGLAQQAVPPNAPDTRKDGDKNEMFTDLTLGGVYFITPQNRQDMQLNFGGSVFARKFDTYDDNNDQRGDGDFQITNLQASALKGAAKALYEIRFDTLWLDLSESRLSTNYIGSFGISFKTDKESLLPAAYRPKYVKLEVSSQRNLHKTHPTIANNVGRTGRKHSLHLAAIFMPDANRATNGASEEAASNKNSENKKSHISRLQLDLQADRYEQTDNSGNYTRLGINSDIVTKLPFAKFNVGLAYMVKQYVHAAQRGTLSALWGLHRRRDEILLANAKLERDFAIRAEQDFSLALVLNWRQQRSNIALYDVDNGEIGLMVAKKW